MSHLVSPFGRKFKRPDVNRFVQEHTKEASPEEAIKILLSDITSIQNIAESTDNDLYDPEVARECRAYKSTLCTNDEKGVLDLGLKEIKPMIEFIEENA